MAKGRSVQYFVAFTLSLATLTFGAITAWPTAVIPTLRNDQAGLYAPKDEISTMWQMLSYGMMVGSLVACFISEIFGRRMTVLASAVPFACGTLLAATATHEYLMMFLRGFGVGFVISVVNMYLAEVSDKEIRASLSVCTVFMFHLGSLLVISLGTFISYSTLNYSMSFLPLIFFVTCLGIPESPYFYLKKGEVDLAKRSLMKLKGEANIEEELEMLKQNVKKEMENSNSPLELFSGTTYWRPIVIATGLRVAPAMISVITIQHFLGRITLAFDFNTELIISGAIKFGVCIISAIIADRIGRRPLLICSFLGSGLCLVLAGTYFFLQEVICFEKSELNTYRYVPYISIILCNVISTIGFDSVIEITLAEIFPLNVRAVAMTYCNIFGGILWFIIPLFYHAVRIGSGICGIFWVISFVAFLGAIFSYFMVPETQGKSLNEIQVILKISKDDVPNADYGMSAAKADETLELGERKKRDL